MKYNSLNKIKENKITKMSDDLGLFWAFSNEQFNKQIKKLTDNKMLVKGDKITDIGAGGYIPSKNVTEFKKQMADINSWYKLELKNVKAEKVIEYELNNYESYYIGDTTEALEVLKEKGYTEAQVMAVYNKNWESHQQ